MALVSRRCCFHKVTGIDSVKSVPGIVFNVKLDPLWCSGAAQALSWPSPLVWEPTESTAARATPALTERVLLGESDAL